MAKLYSNENFPQPVVEALRLKGQLIRINRPQH